MYASFIEFWMIEFVIFRCLYLCSCRVGNALVNAYRVPWLGVMVEFVVST